MGGAWEPARVAPSVNFAFCLRIHFSTEMIQTTNAPCFVGKGESVSSYAQDVELWSHMVNMGPIERARALVLGADPVAR